MDCKAPEEHTTLQPTLMCTWSKQIVSFRNDNGMDSRRPCNLSPLPSPLIPSLLFLALQPITTKMNSFKQMKKAIFPVRVNARGCSLVHRDRGMAWAPGIEAANDP
eukprot:Em0005g745a